jgi:hypothetical protein
VKKKGNEERGTCLVGRLSGMGQKATGPEEKIEKPSGQYLGLIGDESLTCRGLNLNPEHFGSFTFIPCFKWRIVFAYFVVCSWQVRHGGHDEDRGKSGRPGTKDRR